MKLLGKTIIGSAQFGFNYGVTNKNGMPRNNEIKKIINYAYKNRIKSYDTASDYGKSETKLGNLTKSIKNINFNTKLPINISSKINYVQFKDYIKNSMNNLNSKKINTIYFHRANELIKNYSIYSKYINEIKN